MSTPDPSSLQSVRGIEAGLAWNGYEREESGRKKKQKLRPAFRSPKNPVNCSRLVWEAFDQCWDFALDLSCGEVIRHTWFLRSRTKTKLGVQRLSCTGVPNSLIKGAPDGR